MFYRSMKKPTKIILQKPPISVVKRSITINKIINQDSNQPTNKPTKYLCINVMLIF